MYDGGRDLAKPAHSAPAKPKKPQMQKKLQCKKKCNKSGSSSGQEIYPHPKPTHPVPAKPKKLQSSLTSLRPKELCFLTWRPAVCSHV